MIAGAVRREVTRQLRMIESQRESDSLRAVHAYARKVFGSTAKADRWLRRPSVRLGGESPVTWLQHHNDPADVYGALDAIAYGTPV
ncbi:MbcA/ParS/Xre antitoxin family protein [Burkholderia cenocepacia]|uniref:MbcA/ParS/Xre antitoxin family protein n=1 Tax=Burkholderia cenocepacia TaxID=95486 RepID=UPI0028591936|nr:MbcA/ParS/Xre antitoxin family protein [Burkholderia cenocepacia]MDR8029531.1 MbcA/ParS/Xre antitoxin family protein [Burkholderia cenocepacia]MDR8042328.1 MbcA/ParS/Xre antitoxin family protein [Burkholderia cenocepacia]